MFLIFCGFSILIFGLERRLNVFYNHSYYAKFTCIASSSDQFPLFLPSIQLRYYKRFVFCTSFLNDNSIVTVITTTYYVYDVPVFRLEPIIATPPGSMTAQDNDAYWFGGSLGGRTSSVPVVVANQHQQQQQHGLNGSRQLQRRRRPAPPQFRPQPLEPPPPPPALSVAFTAVACPWWTVLEGERLFFPLLSRLLVASFFFP